MEGASGSPSGTPLASSRTCTVGATASRLSEAAGGVSFRLVDAISPAALDPFLVVSGIGAGAGAGAGALASSGRSRRLVVRRLPTTPR